MSAPTARLQEDSSRRILGGEPTDREAVLHRRRKKVIFHVLGKFEQDIEPHIKPGHQRDIEDFKRSLRKKINGLSWEAIELMKLEPGESLNEYAVELVEQLPSDANGGDTKS